MKSYIKGDNIITASEKAFRVIYRSKGYTLLETDTEVRKSLKGLALEELKNKAKVLGIENYSKLKKGELIEIIVDIEGA